MGKALRIEAWKMEDGDILAFDRKPGSLDKFPIVLVDEHWNPEEVKKRSFVAPLMEANGTTREEAMMKILELAKKACVKAGYAGVARVYVLHDTKIESHPVHIITFGMFFLPDVAGLTTSRYGVKHVPTDLPFPEWAEVGTPEEEEVLVRKIIVPEMMST